MTRNIVYQTGAIGDFFVNRRRHWSDFYPSERSVFELLVTRGASFKRVLDVGCAAGGLGDALSERFGSIVSYTGVEINRHAAEVGSTLSAVSGFTKTFINADICHCRELEGQSFDLVTVLGVADWNIDAEGIVAKCWERVAPEGHLVLSLRLTPDKTVCDITRSYQYIWYKPEPPPVDAERAAYHVFNVGEAISWLTGQAPRPENLYVYGYWGKPSATARTPYKQLLFSVFALRKPASAGNVIDTPVEVHLPASAFTGALAALPSQSPPDR